MSRRVLFFTSHFKSDGLTETFFLATSLTKDDSSTLNHSSGAIAK